MYFTKDFTTYTIVGNLNSFYNWSGNSCTYGSMLNFIKDKNGYTFLNTSARGSCNSSIWHSSNSLEFPTQTYTGNVWNGFNSSMSIWDSLAYSHGYYITTFYTNGKTQLIRSNNGVNWEVVIEDLYPGNIMNKSHVFNLGRLENQFITE